MEKLGKKRDEKKFCVAIKQWAMQGIKNITKETR